MTARARLLIAVPLGIVASVVALLFVEWPVAALIGWCGGALAVVVPVWVTILPADAARTRALATLEDNSRFAAHAILVLASVVSLLGVGFELFRASDESGGVLVAETALSVASVVLAWTVVQTVYTLRYAHLWWSNHGGVDFASEEPDYQDFAYLAFTIGMTYQVSDTNLTTKIVRRAALRHALLSYLFGTAIIAVIINVVAGLVR